MAVKKVSKGNRGIFDWAALEMGIEPNPNRTNRTRTLFFERTEQN